MNLKKITAFAAAAVIAAGVCTGVPAETKNNLSFALTAEAEAKADGNTDAAVENTDTDLGIEITDPADAKTTVTGQTFHNKLPRNYSATGGDKKIDVKWDKVKGATSYEVCYSNAGVGDYIKAADVNSTSYTINDLTNGAAYDIMITPDNSEGFSVILNNVLVGGESTSSESSEKLAAPTGFKTSKSRTKIALSWDKVNGADGYRVYLYNEKTGKYEKYKNVKNAKCTISGLKKGTKYKFKVAALVKKDGKYVVQTSSKAVSVTTKK